MKDLGIIVVDVAIISSGLLKDDVIRKNMGNIKISAIINAKIFLIKLPYCFTEPKVNPLTKCL